MKKFISAAIVCVFIFTMAMSALAAVSPSAPTIPDETSTKEPTTVDANQETTTVAPTTTDKVDDASSTKPSDDQTTKPSDDKTTKPTTTKKPDVDETTTAVDETTTKNDVTSDKKPVSPDTGSYVGKSASAAALVALTLGGVAVYTSKKKVTE